MLLELGAAVFKEVAGELSRTHCGLETHLPYRRVRESNCVGVRVSRRNELLIELRLGFAVGRWVRKHRDHLAT